MKLVVDRVIDRNGVREAISNLYNLEWGIGEKAENFVARFVKDLTNANQLDSSWTFITESLFKGINKYHLEIRRSLQTTLALVPNDQRNVQTLKDLFLEVAGSWEQDHSTSQNYKKQGKSNFRCRKCNKKGHKAKDCFSKERQTMEKQVRCKPCN